MITHPRSPEMTGSHHPGHAGQTQVVVAWTEPARSLHFFWWKYSHWKEGGGGVSGTDEIGKSATGNDLQIYLNWIEYR